MTEILLQTTFYLGLLIVLLLQGKFALSSDSLAKNKSAKGMILVKQVPSTSRA